MVDWHSELVQLQCFETIVILAWLTIGFVLREQIATARFDWEILTGKRERKWSQAIYLFVKIVWWVYVALNIVLVYTFNEIDCNTTMWVLEAFMGLMNVSCSILLACRTVCLYQGTARKVVTNTLIIFTLGLVAAWGQGVNSITTVWFPGAGKPWTTGMCVWTAVRTDYCVKYIVTIVFDLTVLMLTVYGVMRIEGFTTKIGQTLTSQGIVYFVVTCVVNALITGFTIAQLNPIMCLIVSMPCSGIAVTASTRLYLELAEGGRPSRPTKTNHAHEESSFGNNLTSVTLNGTVVDKRKSSLGGMRSKGSWASGLSLDVLANSTAPSSLFADTYTPTAPHEEDSQILRQQSIPRKPVPHGSQLFAVEEDIERVGTPVPAIDSDMARSSLAYLQETGCPAGCVTPSGHCLHRPYRPHRSDRRSLSALPLTVAAASSSTTREGRVRSEPILLHLQYIPPPGSPASEEVVGNEFPTLRGLGSRRPSNGSFL
ncbi:unnamed protein product [Tilletia controversa]|uniref:Transmembrane protein n=1 Tax=Tilletia controversa TaxID=13291 RepID=A0A8X7SSN1_9BASI|nr:hypothetical protein CF328_g8121 [Tilletia controversa]KAE8238987.1 hypothetical protein A4X06_0g8550 [Tilletia controversa]CAD6925649.1 unnamed protein product [Tilletia controversa]